MAYQKYNVALIPSEVVGIHAIEMSQMFEGNGGMFTLDSTHVYPHISLYHVPLDPEKVEGVIRVLQETLAGIQPMPLKQSEYRSARSGFVNVGYEKSESLLNLHQAVLQSLKPFWSREIEEKEKNKEWSPEQQTNASEYGWHAVDTLFDPHLTFSRLAEPNPEKVTDMKPQNFSFVSDLVGLFELGEHGTCTRCLAIFELQKK